MLPFFQAYYDLKEENGFGSSLTWGAVREYCRDICIPGYSEFMFDILKTASAKVAEDEAQVPQGR